MALESGPAYITPCAELAQNANLQEPESPAQVTEWDIDNLRERLQFEEETTASGPAPTNWADDVAG